MAKNLLSELFVRITSNSEDLNADMKKMKKQVQDTSGELSAMASQASLSLGAMAVGLGLVIKKWMDASTAMAGYRAKLTTVLKSAEKANEKIAEAIEFAARTPFDVQGIANATTQLEVYGHSAEKWLPLVGDLAAGMGQDLTYTSQVIGKALSGSLIAFRSLRNEFGITAMDLQKLGVKMNRMGGVSIETSKDLEKVQQALEKIIQDKYAGAMDRLAKTFKGSLSNFIDSLTNVSSALGDQLAPTVAALLRVGTQVNNLFLKLPGPIKGVVAWSGVLTAGMAGLGAAALGIVAVLPKLQAGYKYLSAAIAYDGEVLLFGANATMINIAAIKKLLLTKITLKETVGALTAKQLFQITVTHASSVALAVWSAACKAGAVAAGIFKGALDLIAAHPVIATIAVIGLAFNAVIKGMEKDTKRLQEEIKKDEETLKAWKDIARKYSQQTAKEIFDSGVKVAELEEDIAKATKKGEEIFNESMEEFKKGNIERANTLRRVSNAILSKAYKVRQLAKEVRELEKVFRNTIFAIEDFKVKLDLFKKAGFFTIPSQEIQALQDHLDKIRPKIEQVLGMKLDGTKESFNAIIPKIRELKEHLSQLNKRIEGEQNQDLKKSLQVSKNLLEQKISVLEHYFDTEVSLNDHQKQIKEDQWKQAQDSLKKHQDDELSRYDTQIRRLRDLGNKDLQREKSLAEQKLSLMRAQGRSEKEISDQLHQIRQIEYKIQEDKKKKTLDLLQDELDGVEKMVDGQIQAYNRLIKKIQQLISTKQLDAEKGKKFLKKVEDKQDQKEESDQKVKYQNLARTQKDALSQMSNDEKSSIQDRISIINSYIRIWKEEEAKRPKFKKQIEDNILDLVKQRVQLESEIIKNNKQAEKEIQDMKKESLDYEIDQLLEAKLEKGEDVERAITEKIKERYAIESKQMEEMRLEWERQGETRENIELKLAFLKQKNHRDELARIDALISKLKQKNKEEQQKENPPFHSGPMTIDQAFSPENTLLGQSLKDDDVTKKNEDAIKALEARKAQIESELKQLDSELKKYEQYEQNAKPGSSYHTFIQGQKEKIKEQKGQLQGEVDKAGKDAETLFATAVNDFGLSTELFGQMVKTMEQVFNGGVQVSEKEYKAVRGDKATTNTTSNQEGQTSSNGSNININIQVSGGQGSNGGVSVNETSSSYQVNIPKNVLSHSAPDVPPIGRTRFQGISGVFNSESPILSPNQAFA